MAFTVNISPSVADASMKLEQLRDLPKVKLNLGPYFIISEALMALLLKGSKTSQDKFPGALRCSKRVTDSNYV